MSLRRQALGSSVWIAAATGGVAVAQAVQLVALARILAQDAYAVIAILSLILGFVEMLMVAGVGNAIIQRQHATEAELSSLQWVNLAIGVVLGVAVAVSAPVVAGAFHNPAALAPVLVLAIAVPVNAASQVSRACLERELAFREVAIVEFVAGLTSVIAAVAGALLLGIVGVAWGMVVGFAVRSALLLWRGNRVMRLRAHLDLGETRGFLSFGLYQSLNALVGFVDGNLATLVVGTSLEPRVLGGYNLAYNTSVAIPGKLNPIVTRVMFPALSRIRAQEGALDANVLKLIAATGLMNVPVLVPLALGAPLVVELLFGERWAWIVPIVQALAVVGVVRAQANPLGIVLMTLGRQRLGLVVALAKAALALPLMLACVSAAGAMGAAAALIIMGVVTLGVQHVLLQHLLHVPLSRIVAAHAQPLVLGAPGLLLGLAAHALVSAPLGALGASGVAAAVCLGVSVAMALIARPPVVRDVLGALRRASVAKDAAPTIASDRSQR